jgi:hypothetical protein
MSRIRDAFTCEGPFGAQWGYQADAHGGARLYHDANDVPTACAPLWGLCDVDGPAWLNTIRFAWSEHNPGYVPGRYGARDWFAWPGSLVGILNRTLRHRAGPWCAGDHVRSASSRIGH